jgi:hypothetical protein
MSRLVIGLTGPIGSGKSAVAQELERYGFTRVRFAGPLKKMLVTLGLSLDQIDGASKETPSELLCGKTPRQAMQWLGTEWGRTLVGNDLWVNAWRRYVSKLPAEVSVVADDTRFPNEVEAIRAMGGIIVHVKRDSVTPVDVRHISEKFAFEPDMIIDNDGSLEALRDRVRWLAVGLAQGVDFERREAA